MVFITFCVCFLYLLPRWFRKDFRQAVFDQRRIAVLGFLSLILVWVVWSYLHGGVFATLFDFNADSTERLESLKLFFEGMGPFAPFVYVLLVTVEVVIAPIPGTLLYLPGGVIFGGGWGGTLSLLGNILGAGISCQLVRTVAGQGWTKSFFSRKSLMRYQNLIERRGLWIIFLLRVNPLTSSDLVSYASGFTKIRVQTVMLGTLMGMAPLCYVQAYLAEELFTTFPWLMWPLMVACVVYFVVVIVVVRRLTSVSGNED